MALENSIARVLGGANNGGIAGTAFLFAVRPGKQLWMTCHHVIRRLPTLDLGLYSRSTHTAGAGDEPDALTTIACTYSVDLSSPEGDIAVLETGLSEAEMFSWQLKRLALGAAFWDRYHSPPRLVGCGFPTGSKAAFPHGVNFYGLQTSSQWVRRPPDAEKDTATIRGLGNVWNIPFCEVRDQHFGEFNDEGTNIDEGLSGSPICVELIPSALPMCVGMLHARRLNKKGEPTHGLIISFEDIRRACPQVPFHAYADCVIVVLAATSTELTALRDRFDDALRDRLAHYHECSRDGWRPFTVDQPTVRELLDVMPCPEASWQLSSEYLNGDDGAFLDYLADRSSGPLVYVVDPLSVTADTLLDIVPRACDHNRGATYVVPLCDTLPSESRAALKTQLKRTLGERLWKPPHSSRTRFAADAGEFFDRVNESVEQAWRQYIRENPSRPRRMPEWPAGTKPVAPLMGWSAPSDRQ